MPRDRSVRLAVLGSSVQRSGSSAFPSRTASALRRRIVMGGLVLLSLVLITVYFRESAGGGLHQAQGAGATVLHPFEVAAERVARPFRDAYNYTSGLFGAKSENERLRAQVDDLRQRVVANESALQDNVRLRRLLQFQDAPTYPSDYRQVNVRVLVPATSQFEQQIVIAAGTTKGIGMHDPVITADGLVGEVTQVYPHAAKVTLVTDPSSAVSALDVTTGAFGVIRHGQGGTNSIILDLVPKAKVVSKDDIIVTAGSQSGGRLKSIYPRGIMIGKVMTWGQTDTDLYKQVQVDPYVDFGSLDSLAVLVSTKPKPEIP